MAQRIVAFLLSMLVIFLIIDPLWECHDHLDNLRHLGAHGILLILLVVACSGISLLKSFSVAPPNFSSMLLRGAALFRPSPGCVEHAASLIAAAAPGAAGLPLRI
jgi:hypothetical protein